MLNKKNIKENSNKPKSRAEILAGKYPLSILEIALQLKGGMMKDEKRRCNEVSEQEN